MLPRRPYRLVDLFSGAGGLSLGFSLARGRPYDLVAAFDSDSAAIATYRANFGHGRCCNIERLVREGDFEPADVVIGGPPCQGFSLLNRNRAVDERRSLWQPFLAYVDGSGATAFIMENVPQLLGTEEHLAIQEQAERLGFATTAAKLSAADYGVPQLRQRAFVIGIRSNSPEALAESLGSFPPPATHHNPRAPSAKTSSHAGKPWRTVRDAIADLPQPEGTSLGLYASPLDLHFGRRPTGLSRARYRAIPHEGMNRFDLQRLAPEITPQCWIRKKSGGTDLFGRLWWDRPSVTIRTEFFKPEKGRYLHPEQHRPLTHREAARLQSFPDDFIFLGSKTEVARQIGNAVPPLLGQVLAEWLAGALAGITTGALETRATGAGANAARTRDRRLKSGRAKSARAR